MSEDIEFMTLHTVHSYVIAYTQISTSFLTLSYQGILIRDLRSVSVTMNRTNL